MKRHNLCGLLWISLALLIFGCQGSTSRREPIHLNPNMDTQQRYDPQSGSNFFTDGRTMRPPVPNTVARNELRIDDALFRGMDDDGAEVDFIPIELNMDVMRRGQERYDIYCSPCHSRVGDGQGIIMKYDYPIPPPSFHQEKVREFTDGYLYSVISNGVRNMPSYKHQINVKDRWAIVAYVRALQKSQNAKRENIPSNVLSGLN